MDKKTFLEKVAESQVSICYTKVNKSRYRSDIAYRKKRTNTDPEALEMTDYVYTRWHTGGVSGGSCWDASDDPARYHATTGEPEPEFDDFDALVEFLFPEISFMKYKRLATIVEHDSETEYEYYGNSSTYGIKKVVLKNLYDRIVEMGLELKSDD